VRLAAVHRPSAEIFDIPIDLAPPEDLLQTISGWAAQHRSRRVMYVNAHVVNQTAVMPGLRSQHHLYLLGSERPVAREAAARLRRWYPGLGVVGAHHGFFDLDSADNERVIDDINAQTPRVVLVGMGTPKQELWVDRYTGRLDGAVVWTVGGLFSYLSARVPRAPRLPADTGLEWIFRLEIEPARMWRRYLVGNPAFLLRVVSEARANATRPAVSRARR
jgi:N-acetylglucosaminyldiphosphoundecaprenol N-acetyl-beta-D-mannosaminyltransferase